MPGPGSIQRFKPRRGHLPLPLLTSCRSGAEPHQRSVLITNCKTRPLRISLVDSDLKVQRAMHRYFNDHLAGWVLVSFLDQSQAILKLPTTFSDVVLLEGRLPGRTGINCVKQLRATIPDLPIVIFTDCSDHEAILSSLSAGAWGYLLKPGNFAEVVRATQDAFLGIPTLCSEAQLAVVRSLHHASTSGSLDTLTNREREVLSCLTQNLRDKQIATKLGISSDTVHVHLIRAYRKLQVSGRQEAIRKFLGLA